MLYCAPFCTCPRNRAKGEVYESERVYWEEDEEVEDGAQTVERARERQSNGTAEECTLCMVALGAFVGALRAQRSERVPALPCAKHCDLEDAHSNGEHHVDDFACYTDEARHDRHGLMSYRRA